MQQPLERWHYTDAQMSKSNRAALMDGFRAHLKKMGVDATNLPNYSVAVVRPDVAPVVGNIHIPTGRVATRAQVDRRLKKKF